MSGLGFVSPIDGIRVSLALEQSDASRAVYTCVIRWTETSTGRATEATGNVTIVSEPTQVELVGLEHAPEAPVAFVRTLCRTVGRSVQDGRWPRRLTRWRDER